MNITNLGILAHVDAGKTTVTEALLHCSGATRRLGRVDHGDTVADSLGVERERGITVRAATVSLRHRGCKVNLLDTPGHVDFIAEVERSLAVLDAAVLVVSAREGVQAQTRALFGALQRLNIPTLFFLNKLDRLGADAEAALAQIRAQLTGAVLPRQEISGEGRDVRVRTLPLPACEGALEQLFQVDDEIARRYVAGEELSGEELTRAYLRAVAGGALYPVYAGVALAERGIPELLDAIVGELPRARAGGGRLSALAYKLEFHPKHGKLCYLRVYGGAVALRGFVAPSGGGEPFRVTQLFTPEAGGLAAVESVACGDIAVLAGCELAVGDALGEEPPVRRTAIAEPLLLARVTADEAVPREKLLDALSRLCLEDPLLDLRTNGQTGALELRVFGEVQMEVLRALARERYGVALELSEPQTIFRERPAAEGAGDVAWGETPWAAALGIGIAPLAPGSGLQYETLVDYGYLTASFQAAVREGVLATVRHGPYGWELTDARVTLRWAKYSSVMSAPADFRNAAPVAVIRALSGAGTELLEPMLAYSLTVPTELAGRAAYDLGAMNAAIDAVETRGDEITYTGAVPLETSKRYAQTVAAYTKGAGVFAVRPRGWAPFAGDKAAAANRGHELPGEEKYLLQKAGRMA